MLVVIAIIGVLAALLLVAVQAAREASRRAACSNNLRNLALGIQQFDTARNKYPPSRAFWSDSAYKSLPTYPTVWDSGVGHNLSWVHEVMPYIERQDMRAQIENNLRSGTGLTVVQAAYGKLGLVLCPSDETDNSLSVNSAADGTPLPYSQLSYACNAGVADIAAGSPASPMHGFFDWPQNGVFETRLRGSFPNNLNILFSNPSLGDITAGDGASNTILLAENADLEEWNDAPTELNVGIVWDDEYFPKTLQSLNRYPANLNPRDTKPKTMAELFPCCEGATPPIPAETDVLPYARPLSLHPGGFMAAFCDNRVQFLAENMDYGVYARLMTSHGSKYSPPTHNPNRPKPLTLEIRAWQSVAVSDDDY
jgi:hypothetical protein